jgi:hypothetical protein
LLGIQSRSGIREISLLDDIVAPEDRCGLVAADPK